MLVVAAAAAVVFALPPSATALGDDCPDPVNQWYLCYQKRSYFAQQVAQWCSQADSTIHPGDNVSKRQTCINTMMKSYINYRPSSLDPKLLEGCAEDVPTDGKDKLDCYVTIKGMKWRNALVNFGEDCGWDKSTEGYADCAEEKYTDWAKQGGWWAQPATSGSTVATPGGGNKTPAQETPFMQRIAVYLRWITLAIGVVAVFSVVLAGVQYAASGDNASAVEGAKKRMANAVIGIVIYVFMFGLLQWLVPGGIF